VPADGDVAAAVAHLNAERLFALKGATDRG
jgi:hypothetical protein